MNNARSITAISAALSAFSVAVLAFYGGWQRRWMSDDGLIVLRTVRNLLAGNGPVFNAGERVEANTSTLWQYIIYLGALVSDLRLESIATAFALGFTTLAVIFATLGTAGFYRGSGVFLLPFGGLIYISLPPARDFATSGLEWGLAIFWIGLWWYFLVGWATRPQSRVPWLALLAFWSGLSWLVRPELALYGGLAGIMLLVFEPRKWWRILLIAIPVPLAYQIFRMGYYGLLVPHTAVAKSASGSQWVNGWIYLADFNQPYQMWIVALVAIAAGCCCVWGTKAQWRSRTAAIIALVVSCALIHFLYVMRVGGDFMHGRMLLLPLFTALLPVGVIALRPMRLQAITGGLVFAGGMGWAASAVIGGHPYELPDDPKDFNIVDERIFWQLATYRDSPTRSAEDFQTARNLKDFVPQLQVAQETNSGQLLQIMVQEEPLVLSWTPAPRTTETTDLSTMPLSLTMINLGMTSMNAPLDVRVVDTMGLSNPLAARQPRQPDARVGHDKNLPIEWQLADSAVPLEALPEWVDRDYVAAARDVLHTEDFRKLFEAYRAPMNRDRFISNIFYSLGAGRTLQFKEDPYTYPAVLESDKQQPINWPREIHLDPTRGQ